MGASAKKQNNKNHFTIKQITKQQRYYKYFATGLGAFLLAYVCASTLAPVQNSDAAQQIVIDNQLSDYSITITIPDDVVNIPVSALPGGQLATKKTSVNIKTDSPSGYKLYLSSSTLDNNLYKDSDSSTSASGYFAPTSGSTSAPIALTQNTWGFALDKTAVPDSTAPSVTNAYAQNFADLSNYNTGTNTPTTSSTWAQVPKSDAPVAILQNTKANDAIGGENLDIYYGVNASTALPSGSYGASVTYTAISEGVNSFDTMQDFTAEQCDNLGTDSSINLTDSRDGKYYRITKLKDGHCWMTQNLALDGLDKSGNPRTLTANDSNVTSNYTFPSGIDIENGTVSVATAPQIYTADQDKTTTDCGTNEHCVTSSEPYGNMYNFMAATAGQGTASFTGTTTQSVCPKGWRLPDNAGDFSYANLMKAYDLPTENVTGDAATNAIVKAQQSPLYFPLTGRFANAVGYQGVYGFYQSRTAYGSTGSGSYYLVIDTETDGGIFWPQGHAYGKSVAISVRCVFGGQADDTMQTFTTTMCNNLAESTATADNRKTMIDSRDGKFYKISKLADGNCWMVSNLALDGMDALGAVRTLTSSDSNVTQDRTLNANISSGTTMGNTTAQIFSGVATNYTTSCGSYQYCITSTEPYGNHYNWIAATAGVGNATQDNTVYESVCPSAGNNETWRLPDNGTASGAKTYSNLVGAYSLPTGNGTNGSAVQTIQKPPLSFPLTGNYGRSAVAQGGYALYWSRTSVSGTATNAHSLHFNSDNGSFYPQGTDAKSGGFSVRCVLGD